MRHRFRPVRRLAWLLVLALALPAAAQHQKKKPSQPLAHTKPTPQQIRRFNTLEKKEEKKKKEEKTAGTIRAPSPN
ncbi:MAG TPA: hypothetical protein VFV74_07195 [Burkholderiales bacterium]|nr:hypothetical protein [Burkholderiales bacterium]